MLIGQFIPTRTYHFRCLLIGSNFSLRIQDPPSAPSAIRHSGVALRCHLVCLVEARTFTKTIAHHGTSSLSVPSTTHL